MYIILFTFVNIIYLTIAAETDVIDLKSSSEEFIRKYKFIVGVELYGSHICTGSIVHPALILTAGSCLIQSNIPTDYTIRAGSNLSGLNDTTTKVAGLIYNPNFVWMGFLRTKIYDAGILVLTEPLTFGDKIGKINLPTDNEDIIPNKKAVVVGWNSYRLHVQKVMVLSNMDCYLKNKRVGYNLHRYPIDTQVCADPFGKCDKDIGIAMVKDNKIFGIYSDHYMGCESGSPAMFTRVTAIRPWILKIMYRYDN